MTSKLAYADIVKEAEAAVTAISDGDLKAIAFAKILDNLLGNGAGQTSPASGGRTRSSAKRGASGKPPQTRKKSGPTQYVVELLDEGFFATPKTIATIDAELVNRGHHIVPAGLATVLVRLCQSRKLRRQKIKGQTYAYSQW